MDVKNLKYIRNNQIKVKKRISRKNNMHIPLNEFNNRYENINNNKKKYLSNKNTKKNIDEDNETKLIICKSETQYPLTFRQNKNNSMQDLGLNFSPLDTKFNLRINCFSSKHIKNKKDKKLINKKIIYDSGEYINNNIIKTNYNDYNYISNNKKKNRIFPLECIPNLTLNNFNNLYNPINKQINDSDFDNDYNIHFNKTLNRREDYNKDVYHVFKINKRKMNKKCKSKNDIIKRDFTKKELLDIYKEKLIKIFVKFMKHFFIQYNIIKDYLLKLLKKQK